MPVFSSYQFFFQVAGLKSTSIGKSSRRPAIMLKVRTTFEKPEKPAKLDAGPTSLRPGPMLLIVAATAVKFVTMSWLSRVIRRSDVVKTRI